MKTQHLFIGTRPGGRRVYLPLSELVHAIFLGATRLGKSMQVLNIVRQLWQKSLLGSRLATITIDPHGDLYEDLVRSAWVMGMRDRVVLFDPGPAWSPGFNPLDQPFADVDVASLTLRAVHKVCKDVHPDQMPRLQRHLRAILRVLEASGLTLVEAYDFIQDKGARAHMLENVQDERLRSFWDGFDDLAPRLRAERIESTENRIDRLVVSSPLMQRILGAAQSTIDIGQIMDQGKHLIVNLGHAHLTHEQRSLIGALLVESIFEIAVRRPRGKRSPCYVVVDEMADLLSDDADVPRALAQSAKFGTHWLLVAQMFAQLAEDQPILKSAVLTNCTTRFVFGGSREDAEIAAGELFTGEFDRDEIKHEDFATKFRPVESTRTIRGHTRGSVHTKGTGSVTGGGSSDTMTFDPQTGLSSFATGSSGSDADVVNSASSTIDLETETDVPFVESHEFRERTGVQYRTPEELRERYTARLKRQPERCFHFQCGHHRTAVALRAPHVALFDVPERILQKFLTDVYRRTGCMLPVPQMDCQLLERRQELSPALAVNDSVPTTLRPEHRIDTETDEGRS